MTYSVNVMTPYDIVGISPLFARGDMVIRHSKPEDLPYIRHLQRQESYALGWIPEQIMERVWGVKGHRFSGWILLCEVNLQPVGFVFAAPGATPPYLGRIYQCAVQEDARREEYGTFLIDCIEGLAKKTKTSGFQLRCASELPANYFWQRLGYRPERVVKPGERVGDSPRVVRRCLNLLVKRWRQELWEVRGP